MGMQIKASHHYNSMMQSLPKTSRYFHSFSPNDLKGFKRSYKWVILEKSLGFKPIKESSTRRRRRREHGMVVASSSIVARPFWDAWKPEKASYVPTLRALAAMAILGMMDQILAPKGISMTIAPLGAVCAFLLS
ncbi:hypothetical protein CFOL_v3_25440, partial [Cephalotus follicularis]